MHQHSTTPSFAERVAFGRSEVLVGAGNRACRTEGTLSHQHRHPSHFGAHLAGGVRVPWICVRSELRLFGRGTQPCFECLHALEGPYIKHRPGLYALTFTVAPDRMERTPTRHQTYPTAMAAVTVLGKRRVSERWSWFDHISLVYAPIETKSSRILGYRILLNATSANLPSLSATTLVQRLQLLRESHGVFVLPPGVRRALSDGLAYCVLECLVLIGEVSM